ncbi:MAG: hypothetical protein Q4G60_10565 [bacterium]|nr:hypothetical protein [bacterium]
MPNKKMYLICSGSTGMYVIPVHVERETEKHYTFVERIPDISKAAIGKIIFKNREAAEQRLDQLQPPDEDRNDRTDRMINQIRE